MTGGLGPTGKPLPPVPEGEGDTEEYMEVSEGKCSVHVCVHTMLCIIVLRTYVHTYMCTCTVRSL